MTPEQLEEIEKLLEEFWDGSIPYNPKLGVEIADRAEPLVKALREAWEERDKSKAALDAELPAAWREDIESLNSCLERIGKERDEARAACFRLESERNQAVKDRDASYDAIESARATIRHAQEQKAEAVRQRDAVRAEVERLKALLEKYGYFDGGGGKKD